MENEQFVYSIFDKRKLKGGNCELRQNNNCIGDNYW